MEGDSIGLCFAASACTWLIYPLDSDILIAVSNFMVPACQILVLPCPGQISCCGQAIQRIAKSARQRCLAADPFQIAGVSVCSWKRCQLQDITGHHANPGRFGTQAWIRYPAISGVRHILLYNACTVHVPLLYAALFLNHCALCLPLASLTNSVNSLKRCSHPPACIETGRC